MRACYDRQFPVMCTVSVRIECVPADTPEEIGITWDGIELVPGYPITRSLIRALEHDGYKVNRVLRIYGCEELEIDLAIDTRLTRMHEART